MSELIIHLEAQVASAERLLAIVSTQSECIKVQDVQGLLARLGDFQNELFNRRQLELERDRLINTAAARLGILPDSVAAQARGLGNRLRDTLNTVARAHGRNRALIRQELTFVDHLLRALSGVPQAGYSPAGWSTRQQPVTSVDARG
jgi:hypothetical protein